MKDWARFAIPNPSTHEASNTLVRWLVTVVVEDLLSDDWNILWSLNPDPNFVTGNLDHGNPNVLANEDPIPDLPESAKKPLLSKPFSAVRRPERYPKWSSLRNVRGPFFSLLPEGLQLLGRTGIKRFLRGLFGRDQFEDFESAHELRVRCRQGLLGVKP